MSSGDSIFHDVLPPVKAAPPGSQQAKKLALDADVGAGASKPPLPPTAFSVEAKPAAVKPDPPRGEAHNGPTSKFALPGFGD
jgi:hypothetical protein